MRWLKCDLQMQTPADARHWAGDRLEAGHEAASAKAFAEACYQQRLEVVGITDHNFLSKDFIPHLQTRLRRLSRSSTTRSPCSQVLSLRQMLVKECMFSAFLSLEQAPMTSTIS